MEMMHGLGPRAATTGAARWTTAPGSRPAYRPTRVRKHRPDDDYKVRSSIEPKFSVGKGIWILVPSKLAFFVTKCGV